MDERKLWEMVGRLLEGLCDFDVPGPPIFSVELPAPDDRLLTVKEICEKLSVGETTLNEWIASGFFLQPVKLNGGRQRYWKNSAVNRWIADRA